MEEFSTTLEPQKSFFILSAQINIQHKSLKAFDCRAYPFAVQLGSKPRGAPAARLLPGTSPGAAAGLGFIDSPFMPGSCFKSKPINTDAQYSAVGCVGVLLWDCSVVYQSGRPVSTEEKCPVLALRVPATEPDLPRASAWHAAVDARSLADSNSSGPQATSKRNLSDIVMCYKQCVGVPCPRSKSIRYTVKTHILVYT